MGKFPRLSLRRASHLRVGGASLIPVQLLRLPTWQYPSPRAGQPIKVARIAQETMVDTEITFNLPCTPRPEIGSGSPRRHGPPAKPRR